jgi:hypothetical protein
VHSAQNFFRNVFGDFYESELVVDVDFANGVLLWSGIEDNIDIPAIKFGYSSDTLSIEDSRIILGNSDFKLSGLVSDISSFVADESSLRADFDFVSAPTSGLQMQADNISRMLEESRQMGLNISGTDGAANTSGVALEIIRNAQTAKLRLVNQTCAKAIEEQLRRAGEWLLNFDVEAAAENIKYTPAADLAKVKPTMTELSAFANVAEKFSVTRRELREWLEENFDIEHKDWDDLQAELDAERDLAEIGTGFNIPPVVNEDDPSGEDGNKPKAKIGFTNG